MEGEVKTKKILLNALPDVTLDYQIGDEIGRGGFSVVKEAVHKKTGERAAIKIVQKIHENQDSLLQEEIHILRMVAGSPHVVKLYEVYEDDDRIYIGMELLKGGTLLDKILNKDHYTEKDAADILASILIGMESCHKCGIVHRDMKPENLLYPSDDQGLSDLKITDFGLAVLLEGNMATDLVGTREYLAPEMIHHTPYSFPVDMWSIGCIAYTLLCGYHPFSAQESTPLYTQILTEGWSFYDEDWRIISDSAKDFVSQLLVMDPVERMNVRGALMHPFISQRQSVASKKPLSDLAERLRVFQARSKLLETQRAILAVNRIKNSQLNALNDLRSCRTKLFGAAAQTIKKIDTEVLTNPIQIEQKVFQLESEVGDQNIKELNSKEEELLVNKTIFKSMQYIKGCVASGLGSISKQEEKIEELIEKYKKLKEAAKNTENEIREEILKMKNMAMEEEMKILEQIESHNAILKEQSKSYKELMKYVNNSSRLLQNKRIQGEKHLIDSIDKESSTSPQTLKVNSKNSDIGQRSGRSSQHLSQDDKESSTPPQTLKVNSKNSGIVQQSGRSSRQLSQEDMIKNT